MALSVSSEPRAFAVEPVAEGHHQPLVNVKAPEALAQNLALLTAFLFLLFLLFLGSDLIARLPLKSRHRIALADDR